MLGNNERAHQGSSVTTTKPWAINCIGSTVSIPVLPVLFEDKSRTPDGTYPLTQDQLTAKYNWRYNDWYPRCCMACSLNGLYPIHENRWHAAAIAVPEEITSSCEEMDFCGDSDNVKMDERVLSIDDLPDHVIVSVFENIHKAEIMRSISLVCKRWNRLCQAPRLWHEIRIVVCNEPSHLVSIRSFLYKVCRFIRKICIYILNYEPITETDFMNLFPPQMVAVTMLDIGFLCYFTIPIVRFLIRCFPNVEKLNVEGLKEVEEGAFKLMFSEGFPRLRELILSHCESLTLQDFDALCRAVHPLSVLSIDGIVTLQSYAGLRLADSPMVSSLTRLYLDGEEMYDAAFGAITRCRNLELLSVSYCESATNLSLRYIKSLSKLKHLHLRKGKEFTEEGLRYFFELNNGSNASASTFPAKLRYLNLGECPGVNDIVVDLLTKSCPELVSLCLAWCWSVTDIGFTKLVRRLSKLEFLDIRGMDCIDGRTLLQVPEFYLEKLRYLGAEQCPRIEDSTLQILNLQKKDLIISNYHNYFITFELRNGVARFGERFDKQFQDAVNDLLSRYDGYCCMAS